MGEAELLTKDGQERWYEGYKIKRLAGQYLVEVAFDAQFDAEDWVGEMISEGFLEDVSRSKKAHPSKP